MDTYKPQFTVTDAMIALVSEISEEVGKIILLQEGHITPFLRRKNRIISIHSSLAIENNTLTLDQVTAIINGKRVLGPENEIQEVKNADKAYELLPDLDPLSVNDLLKAHRYMMSTLMEENGRFRSGHVGISNGKEIIHFAPPPHLVPGQIQNLISWYGRSSIHPLIKSAVFHYEFEFIHPFADGNGRMGRMWHTLLLGKWKDLFFWLPIEELIRYRQQEYYQAFIKCNNLGDCTSFIKLMLEIIKESLRQMVTEEINTRDFDGNHVEDHIGYRVGYQVSAQNNDQIADKVLLPKTISYPLDPVERLLLVLGDETLSALQLMERLGLSHRSAFRKNYLVPALNAKLVERTIPNKPNSNKQKYRKATKAIE